MIRYQKLLQFNSFAKITVYIFVNLKINPTSLFALSYWNCRLLCTTIVIKQINEMHENLLSKLAISNVSIQLIRKPVKLSRSSAF